MALIDIVVFAAGGAVVWFGKDYLVKWWQGAAGFAASLEAKATAVKAAITPATPAK